MCRKHLYVYDCVYEHGEERTSLPIIITWGKVSPREVVEGSFYLPTLDKHTHTYLYLKEKGSP